MFVKRTMNKKAGEVKTGNIIKVGGEDVEVEEIEISDIGKQGTKKVRIIAKKTNGEKIIIIRPEDYPLDVT